MPVGISGVLNVDKPLGVTSHDVVSRIRRIAAQKAIGHAGTLDPLASGVLVILLGRATILSSYAMASRKRYLAEIVFGAETNTDDVEGEIVARAPVPALQPHALAKLMEPMIGSIMQAPPVFSAIKKSGHVAYRAARKGEPLELAARRVAIHALDILTWEPPSLTVSMTTGPGVYVRALARDVGRLCGSAAHLHTLVRVSSGSFQLDAARKLDSLSALSIEEAVMPSDRAVLDMPAIALGEEDSAHMRHGRRITKPRSDYDDAPVRVYGVDGRFLGLAKGDADTWQPLRVMEAL